MTQLTQVSFNGPMTQHDPMTQRGTCAIRFSPLRNNGPHARRRDSFPFFGFVAPACWNLLARFGSVCNYKLSRHIQEGGFVLDPADGAEERRGRGQASKPNAPGAGAFCYLAIGPDWPSKPCLGRSCSAAPLAFANAAYRGDPDGAGMGGMYIQGGALVRRIRGWSAYRDHAHRRLVPDFGSSVAPEHA